MKVKDNKPMDLHTLFKKNNLQINRFKRTQYAEYYLSEVKLPGQFSQVEIRK